ncbi:uncharacterized protein LAJ45_05674 [Morchella importuna]|uniref:uncharacterized protein n=1 Tax=Morchella importuna TaxID=1174673 RepID=UPI001E8E7107|nr:uncharacterized protein LAJ45_05674 [Morchella importuna]KAH8150461.1 hypothetical protein LAJ45_05674 [Morchella importuna]
MHRSGETHYNCPTRDTSPVLQKSRAMADAISLPPAIFTDSVMEIRHTIHQIWKIPRKAHTGSENWGFFPSEVRQT